MRKLFTVATHATLATLATLAAAVLLTSTSSRATSPSELGNVATMDRVDPFVHGTPDKLVPGVGLVKLKGIASKDLVAARQGSPAFGALKGLSSRSGVVVTLIRPVVLGWAFVQVRDGNAATGRVPTESETLALLERLRSDEAVSAVSEDKWMRPLLTPDDPGLGQMWHFDIIGAESAWDITQGVSSQRVGIIDTGLVRDHEDVGNRAVAGFDFISNSGTANDGNGRDNDFDDPGDGCGGPATFHGTHVAGTVGATADNGTGVVGLNWNAGLVIARTLGVCGGDLVDIGEAAVWMAGGQVDNVPPVGANQVSVMNLSLGSQSACSGFEQDVVDFANQQGSVFVAAAGNDGGAVGSPANCSGVVSVAAHGPSRALTNYSSFGSEIEIVAPGGDLSFGQDGGVLSSIGPNADFYTFQQGTSMASPHVAGAISLMQAINPTLSRVDIISILQNSGTACANCGTKRAMLLDAALAATPAPADPVDPVDPVDPIDGEDDLEENDSFDSAKGGIECNESVALFASQADQDWFLIGTGNNQQVQISVSSSNGADLDLYVLDGPTNEDIIAFSETTTGNESVNFTASGVELHVLVNPFETATGPYTFTVTCVGGDDPVDPGPGPDPVDPGEGEGEDEPVGPDPGAAEDTFEPNESIEDAFELFCDEEKNLTARNDDLFAVEVREGDDLSAVISSNGLALTTAILTLDGTVLKEGTDTQPARANDLDGGTYIVKVTPAGGVGTYRLRAACTPPNIVQGPAANGGCSSTGASAAPMALALLGLIALRRRRR
jgi:serine protease